MFEKILITTGLSTNIWSIFSYVRILTHHFNSEVHLLGISAQPRQVWDDSLASYLNNLASQLREDNIQVKAEFMHGNPAVETAKYVHKHGINLVITSIFKNCEITCGILTNISKKMGFNASIPMLLIPLGANKEHNTLTEQVIRKILVPMNCKESDEVVIPYIKALVRGLSSSVTLLHVNRPPLRPAPILQTEVVNLSRAVGEEYLQKISRLLQSENIATSSVVLDGLPAKTILKYAKDNNIDLIAMTTQYSNRIIDWLFGNTTNQVIEKSSVPVFTMSYPPLETINTKSLDEATR